MGGGQKKRRIGPETGTESVWIPLFPYTGYRLDRTNLGEILSILSAATGMKAETCHIERYGLFQNAYGLFETLSKMQQILELDRTMSTFHSAKIQ
jgi:hypothetical protein